MELVWNVYIHNINSKKIEIFNIFEHIGFTKDVEKHLKEIKDKDEFAEALKGELFYYFYGKCEYEVNISSFPNWITIEKSDKLNKERNSYKEKYGHDPKFLWVDLETEIKVDVRNQVMLNFDIFLDYVWNSKSA